ncbi:MAG: hypothetical protein AAGC67_08935 [Myxococcota bacterium]
MHDPIPFWRPIALVSLAATTLALAACDDPDPAPIAEAPAEAGALAPGDEAPRRARPGDLAAIRDRADAAFADLDTPRARSESRIGPQPWPADLPARWPRLADGRVLADLQRDGHRLLLVDLPGDPREALDRYAAALRAEGFDTAPGPAGGAASLRVRDAATDGGADLTFYRREEVTRVEILFREPASG